MTKVCHMTSAHTRYDTRIFHKECCSLAEAGYEVTLVVSDNGQNETASGVHIVTTGYAPQSRIHRMLRGTYLVYRKALRVDASIYHLHDPELLLFALSLVRRGKRVIFDSHETYCEQIREKMYLPGPLGKLLARLYQRFEKIILSRVDAVITPCTVNGENYFQRFAKKTVLLDNFPVTKGSLPIENGNEARPFTCCYVGSFSMARGIDELLQIARSGKVRLILAGDLNHLPDHYQKEIRDLSRKGLIDYRGFVNRKEAEMIYRESDVGLSLLHDTGQYGKADNLPTKVYEYLLAGIPVILSRNPFDEKFIDQYPVGILVQIDHEREINQAIQFIRNHPEEAHNMGRLGRKIVLDQFCWEREAVKLCTLYQELL